jgi:hypothetical protein
MSVWSAQHYNAIAKEIRELFPTYDSSTDGMYESEESSWHVQRKKENMARRGVLSALALSLAHRFKEDNERFDVMKFLTACSPDNDRFPITELWEDEDEKENG